LYGRHAGGRAHRERDVDIALLLAPIEPFAELVSGIEVGDSG